MIGDRIVVADVEIRMSSAAPADSIGITDTVIELILAEDKDGTVSGSAADGRREARNQFAGITPAELQVLLWLRRGYVTDEEIAQKLHRSAHSIRTQVGSLLQKLGVNSRSAILGLINRMTTGEAGAFVQGASPLREQNKSAADSSDDWA